MSRNAERVLYEEAPVADLVMYPEFREWCVGDIHHRVPVLCDNRAFLKEKLGKQDFVVPDSSNRRVHGWKVELNGGTLWILSAKARGTSYEIVSDSPDNFVFECVEYLKNLFDLPEVEPTPISLYSKIREFVRRLFGKNS